MVVVLATSPRMISGGGPQSLTVDIGSIGMKEREKKCNC